MTLTIHPTCLPCAVCEYHAPGLRDVIIRQGGRYGNMRLYLAMRLHGTLESDEGVPVADMMHWCHPSAEMVAESREVVKK